MNLYLLNKRLHNDTTLKAAQAYYRRQGQTVTPVPVTLSSDQTGAVGVVLKLTCTGTYLAGSSRQGVSLSITKPQRLYTTEKYARVALAHVDIAGDFTIEYVHLVAS